MFYVLYNYFTTIFICANAVPDRIIASEITSHIWMGFNYFTSLSMGCVHFNLRDAMCFCFHLVSI